MFCGSTPKRIQRFWLHKRTRRSIISIIDAFAGAGIHFSKRKHGFVPGSPLNALSIQPPFKEFHLIDLDQQKSDYLAALVKDEPNAWVYNEDCNKVLLKEIFPRCRFDRYKRGLCVLDPYGLHLDWEVVKIAGQMKSLEIFLNFPVADMNRNVLWTNPNNVDKEQIERMNAFWGDISWKKAAYSTTENLFGFEEKTNNFTIAKAYQERLKNEAGFSFVPDPIPMRNSKSAIVYYLFFASQKPVAANIVTQIFSKYKNRGIE